ncbi:MAG: regulatory protein GemA [Rhodoferax sp.]|nr:regulatory protein GemA [Rhodoferax sp.]
MSTRTIMISKIHVAKRQLALPDDSYRDVLRRKTGKESTGAMSHGELETVLREFERLGFKPTKRGTFSKEKQIRMIRAVWKDITHLGIDAEDHVAALRSFVGRVTRTKVNPLGVSDPEFLDSTQANKVLEGLKAWRTRLRQQAQKVAA